MDIIISRRLLLFQMPLILIAGCTTIQQKLNPQPTANNTQTGDPKALKSSSSLQVINIPPNAGGKPTNVIVALHGWGSNAEDLAAVAPALNLPSFEIICPQGVFPHPRVAGGRMWYDLEGSERHGLAESRQVLKDFLTNLPQTTGVPLEKTFLLGFSQGGAMTLDVGLGLPLAGLVCLSGYLHPITQLPGSKTPPILIVHGREDWIVRLSAAIASRDALLKLGASVQYEEYDMGHEIIPAAVIRVRQFIMANS